MFLNNVVLELSDSGLLTPRERQVLLCDADGMTDKHIAKQLDISIGTVSAYNERIYQKLGVKDRSINARCAAIVTAVAYQLLIVSRVS